MAIDLAFLINIMRILAIETSCDETGIAILEADKNGDFRILSNIVSSQIKIHAPFGGVVPMLAKREHQKNLVPILIRALKESKMLLPEQASRQTASASKAIKENPSTRLLARSGSKIEEILIREPELLKKLLPFLKKYEKPKIDLLAVTNGPGLEPALWVGVNFAKALASVWDLPVMPVNHVEAHVIANWLSCSVIPAKARPNDTVGQAGIQTNAPHPPLKIRGGEGELFPIISLVVSGGHTQLILMRDFGKYEILGETRDDAAGEAFDKLAKMLNLGYPGGPIVAKFAAKFNAPHPPLKIRGGAPSLLQREGWGEFNVRLPRPMLNSGDYDFSFSGLKTAALYFTKTLDKKTLKKLTPAICAEFQQAAIDVLVSKTIRAAKEFGAKTILLSGGVASNDLLRETLQRETEKMIIDKLKTDFHVPPKEFCTDNAAMIALTACTKLFPERIRPGRTSRRVNLKNLSWQKIKVNANLRLA
ncbi:MAG: tRNA (adenosine(37)-N6)-threonylcarbamoyltransferase complex transferase subunit TsaD [bacterium]